MVMLELMKTTNKMSGNKLHRHHHYIYSSYDDAKNSSCGRLRNNCCRNRLSLVTIVVAFTVVVFIFLQPLLHLAHLQSRKWKYYQLDYLDIFGINRESGLIEQYRTRLECNHIHNDSYHYKPKSILVTGAAGFIGMHTALKLHSRDPFAEVVGLDNFNDYYDVKLKRDRAYQLYKKGITMVHGNVCDSKLLRRMFNKHKFTHVVHLAAQAGVRKSIQNPQDYVTQNVMCFVELLEVVKEYRDVVVTYASSSSVYGANTKVPFSEEDPIDNTVSLYAATKKMDESIARVYHSLYQIPLTGLRFFTVYGPWGRPDMAVYNFTDSIFNSKPVNVYSDGSLQRDFTYIDDIVDGVIAAMDAGYKLEVFNLGKGHPEKVNELISIIETASGVDPATVKKRHLPFQQGDVSQTYASITKSNIMLGYEPKSSLEKGIHLWMEWYKDYMKQRKDEEGEKNLRADIALGQIMLKSRDYYEMDPII